MEILENHIMKKYSNMKIGGKAKRFIYVENKDELKEIYENYDDIIIIGNGSNILFDDRDLDYTFVSLERLNKIEKLDENRIKVEAGLDFNKLVGFTNRNDYAGLEELIGIPGSLGGMVYMNGGAYGKEIFDFIEEVEIFDENLEIRTLKKDEIGYSYRMTEIQKRKWVVISATFKLEKGFNLSRVLEIQRERDKKQPLDKPNLGSTFKNPKGDYAARLIMEAGLMGTKVGGAQISQKHSNFIINTGEATFDDVQEIIKLVKKEIKTRYDIDLEEEIIVIRNKNR